MRTIEIDLHAVPFPEQAKSSVHAITGYKPGTEPEQYTIAVDDTQTEAECLASWLHECTHIWLDHFRQDNRSVQEIESETHRMVLEALQVLSER